MDELFERRDVVLLRVSILPEDRIWLVVRMLGDKVPRSTVLAVKEPVNEVWLSDGLLLKCPLGPLKEIDPVAADEGVYSCTSALMKESCFIVGFDTGRFEVVEVGP